MFRSRERNVKLVFVKWKAFKQSAIVFFEVKFYFTKLCSKDDFLCIRMSSMW